jgi:hypothetical protein
MKRNGGDPELAPNVGFKKSRRAAHQDAVVREGVGSFKIARLNKIDELSGNLNGKAAEGTYFGNLVLSTKISELPKYVPSRSRNELAPYTNEQRQGKDLALPCPKNGGKVRVDKNY